MQASDAPGIEGTVLGADGTAAEILLMPAGGTREPASHETVAAQRPLVIQMPNGREVFKRAVTEMAAACRELLEKSDHSIDDVDVLIPHQANARIMTAVVDRLGIDPAKAVVDVAEVGNTSAASIPIALDRAWRAGRIHQGDLVLFTSFGAGLTWGATLGALDDAGADLVTSKVAVVTGASRGIGRACAVALARGRLDRRDRLPQRRDRREGALARSRPPARPGIAVFLDVDRRGERAGGVPPGDRRGRATSPAS